MGHILFNIYGSQDSTDTDVIVFYNDLPNTIEERKNISSLFKTELSYWHPTPKPYNVILARVENGIIVDCTYPKASPESLNNALLNTYHLHSAQQSYDLQVNTTVERNKILAIYKTIRLLGTYLTRTEYRTLIRPTMNWQFELKLKLDKLLQIDFTKITSFNQRNVPDVDIWKSWAFYVVQNFELLKNDNELYTKQDIITAEPYSKNFIYRKDDLDIEWFQSYLHQYIKHLKTLPIKQHGNIMELFNQQANIEIEWPL